jgi:mono/diheme cytochrome c family protein
VEPSVSSPTRRVRAALSIVALGGLAALIAGCGTVGYTEATGDSQRGRELFVEKCGSCHVLADAGTNGTIGPNLDDAFRRSREDGLGESTIAQVVLNQIAYPIVNPPTEQPGMPADIVTGQDAEDVATYVSEVAGLDAPARPQPPVPPPGGEPPPPGGEPPPPGGDPLAEGKEVFASAGCGTCHTLADAGTSGTVGPNLDESRPSKELAVDRVTNGGGAMPPFADQLSPEQIDAVAAYVSSAAGG